MAVLQLGLPVNIAAQKTLARIGPGSTIQNEKRGCPGTFAFRAKTGAGSARPTGPSMRESIGGGRRAEVEGGGQRIRQMGADRVQLDAVETIVSHTVPWHH